MLRLSRVRVISREQQMGFWEERPAEGPFREEKRKKKHFPTGLNQWDCSKDIWI